MTSADTLQGKWYDNGSTIKGFVLDIYGVLYTGEQAIPGSVEAVKRLKESGVPVRLCTNTSCRSVVSIAQKLQRLGYDISPDEIVAPVPTVKEYLKKNRLRPYLIVRQGVVSEFDDIDQENPNCVVLGDALENFSYANMNTAFRVLTKSQKPTLISMGSGRYYGDNNSLTLDVGPFMKALEYSCDTTAKVIGKPELQYFNAALQKLNLPPENVVMIGDDIIHDIGGAQACGMKAVQVRTGKYRPQDEPHPTVTPDGYVDDLSQAVNLFLQHRK